MKITIFITRTKKNNEIIERFSIQPRNKIIKDKSRSIYNLIRDLKSIYSISDIFQIKEMKCEDYYYENVYEFDPKVNYKPKLQEYIEIDYRPVLSKKKRCTDCIFLKRTKKNKPVCWFKGIKLKNTYYPNCRDWVERLKLYE